MTSVSPQIKKNLRGSLPKASWRQEYFCGPSSTETKTFIKAFTELSWMRHAFTKMFGNLHVEGEPPWRLPENRGEEGAHSCEKGAHSWRSFGALITREAVTKAFSEYHEGFRKPSWTGEAFSEPSWRGEAFIKASGVSIWECA
jgi:hypothetical protein